MSVFTAGQDVDRSLHAVDVLVRVQQRLEAAGDEAAAEALHHFHRLSADELDRLVALEVGVVSGTKETAPIVADVSLVRGTMSEPGTARTAPALVFPWDKESTMVDARRVPGAVSA